MNVATKTLRRTSDYKQPQREGMSYGGEYKKEALAGDTVYLQHKGAIRRVLLATARMADPMSGKISINSPIGRALLGRHQGSKVRLNTLDGELEYQIIKII